MSNDDTLPGTTGPWWQAAIASYPEDEGPPDKKPWLGWLASGPWFPFAATAVGVHWRRPLIEDPLDGNLDVFRDELRKVGGPCSVLADAQIEHRPDDVDGCGYGLVFLLPGGRPLAEARRGAKDPAVAALAKRYDPFVSVVIAVEALPLPVVDADPDRHPPHEG